MNENDLLPKILTQLYKLTNKIDQLEKKLACPETLGYALPQIEPITSGDDCLQFLVNYVKQQIAEPIDLTIFHRDGSLLATTQKVASYYGRVTADIVGLKINEFTPVQGNEYSAHGSINFHWDNIIAGIRRALKLTISTRRNLLAIDFSPSVSGDVVGRYIMYSPIFDQQSQVVGVMVNADDYYGFDLCKYFIGICKGDKLQMAKNAVQKIKLSTRQHEIIFLLANGFNQREIAKTLNITRGTVAHVINKYLCPKFGISGTFIDALISLARKYNYASIIPNSLYKNQFIILKEMT